MQVSDLTRVLLQGRRFFRPFVLETRPLRRIVHPFGGLISTIGFTIVFLAFVYKDFVRENAKEALATFETVTQTYLAKIETDQIVADLKTIKDRILSTPAEDADRQQRYQQRRKILDEVLSKNRQSGKTWEAFDRIFATNPQLEELYEGHLFHVLLQVTEEKKRELQQVSIITYSLYAIGFCLGLLGQLAGIEPKSVG